MKYLYILFILTSCTDKSGTNLRISGKLDDQVIHEQLDTLKIRPYRVKSEPAIFETAFFTGATAAIEDTIKVQFYTLNIGKLKVETGELVACDPVILHDSEPFIHQFPIGQYPVHLAIAKTLNDQRVAFARVYFSSNPVSKWEFALLKGQENTSIFSDSIYGYGVDAGLGLFLDKAAAKAFNDLYDKDPGLFEKIFLDEMDKFDPHNHSCLLYDFNRHNLAAFSTGYGDGFYATYVGYDKQGNICRLLTDFGVVEWLKK